MEEQKKDATEAIVNNSNNKNEQQENDATELKFDILANILDRIITLTHGCDTKASIILGCLGVFAGSSLSSDNIKSFCNLFKFLVNHCFFTKMLAYLGFPIAALLMSGGFVVLLCVLIPRTKPLKHETNNEDLTIKKVVFFGDIAEIENGTTYSERINGTKGNKVDWNTEYINEIYICSRICDIKYKLYRWGLLLSAVGAGLFFVVAVFGVVINRCSVV